ncbi:hypothetical protein [Candidatus Nanohalovita haloferacivicina]|uniref:hypothetical protein n=1 Tax=Candidatus Nanohalovita haloferacivicina TaxID=2978046 RepID=UPI00325FA61F|nr:hypothetical protein HBNXNv_0871 [Candidatus Nanohalobia archaeon BNXNv]
MKYRNSSYGSNRSTPPEIVEGGDEVAGADREQINELFSELGVDATAQEVLNGAETAEVSMQVQLDHGYAQDYWKATMHNDDVLARQVMVEIGVDGAEDQRYLATDVWKPAYDVFSLPAYMETESVEDDSLDVSADADVTEPATMD